MSSADDSPPLGPVEDAEMDETQVDEGEGEPGSSRSSKAPARRRTKTGCLTCRRRRIKCGEERPICKNCIKSKRECSGYNPPLVYKQHAGQPAIAVPGLLYRPEQILQTSHTPPVPGYSDMVHQGNVPGPYLTSTMPSHLSADFTSVMGASNIHSAPVSATSSNAEHNPYPQLPMASIYGHPLVSSEHLLHSTTDTPQPRDETSMGEWPLGLSDQLQYQPQRPSISAASRTFDSLGFLQLKIPQAFSDVLGGIQHDHHAEDHLDESEDGSDCVDDAFEGVSLVNTGQHTDRAKTLSEHRTPVSLLWQPRHRSIFDYFLASTAPLISVFDRKRSPSATCSTPLTWTESLPAMTSDNKALASAMLGIASVHMMQRGMIHIKVPIKHFITALRRVQSRLADEVTRHHVSTLATVLILGFHEVIGGDHSRWFLHLSAAAKLVEEQNFTTCVQTINSLRTKAKLTVSQAWAQHTVLSPQELIELTGIPEVLLDDRDWDVDSKVVSRIMGMKVDYDAQEQPDPRSRHRAEQFTHADVLEFQILMDLFWWYCKQDIFQSILSGDAPMLAYSNWKYCPPRGRLGDANRPHASVDYLWLIFGRLLTFGTRDRSRKLRVVESIGGEWAPAPGFLSPSSDASSGQGRSTASFTRSASSSSDHSGSQPKRTSLPPTANEGRARKARPQSNSPSAQPPSLPPAMFGMMPPVTEPVSMPASFRAMEAELKKGHSPAVEDRLSDGDLDTETRDALEEYASISGALDLWEESLGEGFQPVHDVSRHTTPFGPALTYATPQIAAMWAFYHTARIVLRRHHPHSPPAAMVSAGVNAQFTQEHAYKVARICGGLYVPFANVGSTQHPSHDIISSLAESTFPMLLAGVQFQDAGQRGWTISRLSEIARLVGWHSSAAVAAACETTWEKMGEMGKGPPYQRTLDTNNADARVRGKTIDDVILSSASQIGSYGDHESRFVSHDRNLIDRHASTRTHWAVGLLALDEDLKKINISDTQR